MALKKFSELVEATISKESQDRARKKAEALLAAFDVSKDREGADKKKSPRNGG